MTTVMDSSNADEYYLTALQIFEYCGAKGSSTLRVDAVMDKFAPFIKTDKPEYSFLKSLLDPDQINPEINVTNLAKALNKYSESQKSKVDLDESFNLGCGHAPQDSDSGISTDGFQQLEELQSNLREKSHLAHKLRSQLEFTDRQHEEALSTLTAERDSLRAHLNMLREENLSLAHLRPDHDEMCERLCANEQELSDARCELDLLRRRVKLLAEQVSDLEVELGLGWAEVIIEGQCLHIMMIEHHLKKLSLQELLSSSKEECHRVNEMYASRQCALLEQNETLKSSHADLAARLQDQDEFLQQLVKEKVLLEMELKDMLNRSNQPQLRLERSVDISYTEDQMLTALDSLNADSRFSQDNRLLDEESFMNALKEDQGRTTNISLFDEIRLSISTNLSRQNFLDINTSFNDKSYLDKSVNCIETQTENFIVNDSYVTKIKETEDISLKFMGTQTDGIHENDLFKHNNMKTCMSTNLLGTQIQDVNENHPLLTRNKVQVTVGTQYSYQNMYTTRQITTQTDDIHNNNNVETCIDCSKCLECEKLQKNVEQLQFDVKHSQTVVKEAELELSRYEDHLNVLQNLVKDGNMTNSFLQTAVDSLQSNIALLEKACANQRDIIDSLNREMCCAQIQTDSDVASVSTQVEVPCVDCQKRNAVVPQRNFRRYFWEPLKCLFQLFAALCFVGALSLLYGVSVRVRTCPVRAPVPWRWLHAQDLMDLLLRIEYVADVPM